MGLNDGDNEGELHGMGTDPHISAGLTTTNSTNPKEQIIEEIQRYMPDMPPEMMMSVQQMSANEAAQFRDSLPTLMSAIDAASRGEDVPIPNIPGAQAMIEKAKENHEAKEEIQQTATGVLGGLAGLGTMFAGLAGTAAVGAAAAGSTLNQNGVQASMVNVSPAALGGFAKPLASLAPQQQAAGQALV